MKEEITVRELIGLLGQIENKDIPIDIEMEECYEEPPRRYYITGKIVAHKSDVLKEVRAVSIEIERGYKYDVVTDLVDGYVPLTVEECEDVFQDKNMSRKEKELVTDAINFRRKIGQKEANRCRLNRQEEE
ncbi:MAG: hypothetical protein IJS01_06765 [Lentisphaeria bacterium]|nr:hypothetical protein [Lentisphaeria bacterium]